MTNQTVQTNKPLFFNDEIDLFLLLYKTFSVLKKRYIILLSFLLIGAGTGLSTYLTQKPVYKSILIGNSDLLRNEYVVLIFENLNTLISEGNYVSLASYLSVNEKVAKTIIKLKATPVVLRSEKEMIGTERLMNTFQIEILIYDPSKLDIIQEGIIHYIRNNTFAKTKAASQEKLLRHMVEKLEIEINNLDTLRNIIIKKNFNSNANYSDPSSINNSIISLNEKKLNLQNTLETMNQVLIIQKFMKYERPISPTLKKNILIGISVGFITAIFLIVVLEIKRKL